MAAAKVKSVALSVTHKCRNILAAGWEARLNTIKADAKGSPIRGQVASLLKSLNKIPPRVAMTGDVLRLNGSKVPIIADSLKKAIMREHEASSQASHGVSAILSSAGATSSSCVYIDSSGSSHNIELDCFEPPKADLLIPERDILTDVPRPYHWKEFRFSFKEPAKDAEDFCRTLVELEQEVLQSVKSYSGLG
ncbi:hypothetical protein BAE44_0012148 [Dichanthelium oligosanthes]|uniref:Uncharacterized protein n=1 Tax=Dichanthelium oligosanthes TaxID=888268 RepID=A0A1E5VNY3_9POAL|nr:hypothetical protein BAE44_0012148 [Dichanthelium oligosanthes]